MKISWKALLLAPMAVPCVASAILQTSAPGKDPVFAFFFVFLLGCAVSYAATVFLFLPALYLISRVASPTAAMTATAGGVLGGLAWCPLAWQSYCATGVDSGPPAETFVAYLLRQFPWPDLWFFVCAGAVTALLYRYLERRSQPRRG